MFSIIIPLYNKAPYIEKAIRSVAAQSFQEFELILIDDGSSDDGLKIVNRLFDALTPPLGGWGATQQSNAGVSVARNNGVALAKYDYIAFLDADDWWEPTFLEEMKGLIESFPEAGIYGSSYFKVKDGKNIPAKIGVEEGFQSGLINYFQVYAKTMWMPLWTGAAIIKKSVYNENNGFKPALKLGEDFDLWVRVSIKYPVAFLNMPLAYYNQDVDQTMRGVVNNKIYDPNTIFIFNLDYLKDSEMLNNDLKILLDKLRAYVLIRYQIQNAYPDYVKNEISKVDFKNIEFYYKLHYKLPLWVVNFYYILRSTASKKLKKYIKK